MKPDDTDILDSEAIYRRVPGVPFVHMVLKDEETGETRAKRGAFKWDKDGCSGYRHSLLTENGLTWEDVKKRPENGVLRVYVADLRNNLIAKIGIANDPWPDVPDPHPRDVAHALMVAEGLINKKREQALSEIASRAVVMPGD